MRLRTFWYLIATLVVLLLMAMVVDVPPAQGDDTLVCMEDEVAWVVDYRTEGAVDDAAGVTRICIAMDTINDYAFEAGSQDGYAKGWSDGFYEAVDGTLRPVYDDGYGDGYDDGYADATREDQEWHAQTDEIACAVIYVLPEPIHRHWYPSNIH